MDKVSVIHGKPAPLVRRLSLFLGCGGLAAAALICAAGAFREVVYPAPSRCPLPTLPLIRCDSFVWRPDSRQLLVGGQGGALSLVRFPELQVERLPPAGIVPDHLAWDGAGRPLVMGEEVALRWRAERHAWERLDLPRGVVTPSPDGQYLAVVPAGVDRSWNRSPGTEAVLVYPLNGKAPIARLDTRALKRLLPPSSRDLPRTVTVEWKTSTVLDGRMTWFGADSAVDTWRYDLRSHRLTADPPLAVGEPYLNPFEAAPHPARWQEMRERLRTWKVPGVPRADPQDLILIQWDEEGHSLRKIPLGRLRDSLDADVYRPMSPPSPDGRWLVVSDVDFQLRVFSLK